MFGKYKMGIINIKRDTEEKNNPNLVEIPNQTMCVQRLTMYVCQMRLWRP
jgi:hypothetical protein